jgi:hypothetical protein
MNSSAIDWVAAAVVGIGTMSLAAAETVRTWSGEVFEGRIVADRGDRVVIAVPQGEITLRKSEVADMDRRYEPPAWQAPMTEAPTTENLIRRLKQAKDPAEAAARLVALGRPATPEVLRALAEDWELTTAQRRELAKIIHALPLEAADEPTLVALLDEDSMDVAVAAAGALQALGPTKVTEKTTARLSAMAQDWQRPPEVRAAMVRALAAVSKTNALTVLAVLAGVDALPVQAAAREAFLDLAVAPIPLRARLALERQLSSPACLIRVSVVRCLSIGDPTCDLALARAAKDDDALVRAVVVTGLARSKTPYAIHLLKMIARDDEDASVRAAAAKALAEDAIAQR